MSSHTKLPTDTRGGITTRGKTPASIVTFTNWANVPESVSTVVSPVAVAAIVNAGVKPVDATGFESVAPPLPVVVNR